MPKKSLAKAQVQNADVVSFEYDGQVYQDSIQNLSIVESDEIYPERIRVVLAQAPGRFAFWAGVQADIASSLRGVQDQFDVWLAAKYEVFRKEQGDGKYISEKTKMYWIMQSFPEAYAKHVKEVRALEVARDKAEVLVKSYEMQSRTLQTVGSLLRAELELSGQA